MAKNDVILIDGILDQRATEGTPSHERDEVFEFLALEEMLKDYDLSADELEFGWTDGEGDGGIDGFYIFINGHPLDDTEEFIWPRSDASIDIWLFTCKHHATFVQAPLDAMLATIQEFFDLSREAAELGGRYSEELLEFRSLFAAAYRRLSIRRPRINFSIIYASRGDTSEIGDSVAARARQIESTIASLFSSSSVNFRFVGAAELIASHRKVKRFSLDLPFLEHLATGKDSYILLVRLSDYWKFVSDENGQLRRYLFDSNVRDYLGANQVNEDIALSLADQTAPDFWWLNNGVTILATDATVPGKTIQLQDIQIVNGLQTTETIFRHFKSGAKESSDRALLVKIIVSSDTQARDRIIRATNNQSPVEVAALRATDKIQRDVEEILERSNWYYERRKNYYRNIGKPQMRFVTPLYLTSAVIALIFKNPAKARRLKSKFLRDQRSYESIFSSTLPIGLWPILANIYKQVDTGLEAVSPRKRGQRFMSNWRPLVALLLVAKRLKTFAYSNEQLLGLADVEFPPEEIAEVLEFCRPTVKSQEEWMKKVRPHFLNASCKAAAERYGIEKPEVVGKRDIPQELQSVAEAPDLELLDDGFVRAVDAHLPDQPWQPGAHHEVAKKLRCKPAEVSKAIQQLIAQKKRYAQRDGVLYDFNGEILNEQKIAKLRKASWLSRIFR
jgi:AIPR protein